MTNRLSRLFLAVDDTDRISVESCAILSVSSEMSNICDFTLLAIVRLISDSVILPNRLISEDPSIAH